MNFSNLENILRMQDSRKGVDGFLLLIWGLMHYPD
jgi:hypothetical protein